MQVAFLDRDGIINEDIGYLHTWENFKYKGKVKSALEKLSKANFKLIIVTNQSGIARGLYSESDLHMLTSKMRQDLQSSNISILDQFHCPHLPSGSVKAYAIDCNCRKPKPGLFFMAYEKYNIDRNRSVMFGDKLTDMRAAEQAGIPFRYLISDEENSQIGIRKFKNLEMGVDDFLNLGN